MFSIEIVCSLPSPPGGTYFENPRDSYLSGETVDLVCMNQIDRATWTCDEISGVWIDEFIDCSVPTSKISYPFCIRLCSLTR